MRKSIESGLLFEPFAHDGYERSDLDCDPSLRFDRILASSKVGLDANMLLDPARGELNRPAIFIDLGDDERWMRGMSYTLQNPRMIARAM